MYSQIDGTVEEATRRRKTNGALDIINKRRKQRAGLVAFLLRARGTRRRTFQYLFGNRLTNPSRLGILTCGSVFASMTSLSPMMPLSRRMCAVTAYTSSSVSDFGAVQGIALRVKSNTMVA